MGLEGYSTADGAYLAQDGAYVAGTFVVEPFDTEVRDGGPWWGGSESGWSPDPDHAYRGANAGRHDPLDTDPINQTSSKWSVPGLGAELARYPGPGDTIRLAVAPQPADSDGLHAGFTFAKPAGDLAADPTSGQDGAFHSYWVFFDISTYHDYLEIRRYDAGGDTTRLGYDTQNVTDGDWYVLEAEYDGGGYGVHTATLYATEWDGPGTGVRADPVMSVTADFDDTWRGEGVGVRQNGPGWVDELTILPG